MKLRIRGNSIRLRLTRGEVERMVRDGRVEETVDFGPLGRNFRYVLEAGDIGVLTADFDGERIAVTVPRGRISEWAATESVGFEDVVGSLRILVEKDFACLAPRAGEDETDMFANPSPEACAG